MSETKTYDENSPATKRQLWALFCLTKTDHRKKNLTFGEASKLLDTLNAGNIPLKSVLDEAKKYITENCGSVAEVIRDELRKTSLVGEQKLSDRICGNTDAVRYKFAFAGSGCGFGRIEVDKRSKKAVEVEKNQNLLSRYCRDEVQKKFGISINEQNALSNWAITRLIARFVREKLNAKAKTHTWED